MLFYCFQGMKLLAFKTIVQFQFIILTKCTLFCSKVELSSHDLNFMDPKHLASKPSQMVILDLKALTMTMVSITLLFCHIFGISISLYLNIFTPRGKISTIHGQQCKHTLCFSFCVLVSSSQ